MGTTPAPKSRPALVLQVAHDEGDENQPWVTVAYCTTQKTDDEEIYSTEFVLNKDEAIEFKRTGLTDTTKIDVGHLHELPFTSEYFEPPPEPRFGKIPKLGALPGAYNTTLKTALAAAKAQKQKKAG